MGKKIAAVDNQAMNELYSADVKRIIASKDDLKDLNGAPEDQQAFDDHEEMIETLANVLSDDKKSGFSPNDEHQD